jgi:hypothetical protein
MEVKKYPLVFAVVVGLCVSSAVAQSDVEKAGLQAELDKKAEELAAEEAKLMSQIQSGLEESDVPVEVLKPASALTPPNAEPAPVKAVIARRIMDTKEADSISKDLRIQRAAREKLEVAVKERERDIAQLKEELSKTKDRLMIAETEVERLSEILDAKHRNTISKYVGGKPSSLATAARGGAPERSEAKDDMPVATVISDKAYLRTGPGKQNSPLMSISKGTRLVVETREGEWYRVITPAGTRAWIASELVNFSNGGVRGYDSARR